MRKINIEFSPEIIGSYKRLSYKVWYALAEFVDNSTQAFYDNRDDLLGAFTKEKSQLEVHINYHKGVEKSLKEDYFEIIDNSIGMSSGKLKEAFSIGSPPQNPNGRSRYGLGMKTAAFWLGDEWTVTTTRLNDSKELTLRLNAHSISAGNLELRIDEKDVDIKQHYTRIRIEQLHRRFKTRSIHKIKSYLSSIYRFDLDDKQLALFWNNEPVGWVGFANEDFVPNREGKIYKRTFDFSVSEKNVSGWAGILKSGGRNRGGFSIVQSNRVIQCPPDAYKPESIFGEQEGGINDLINQRIVGELFLDGFEVSHTKDSILWQDTQEDDLDEAIKLAIGDFKRVAVEYRSKSVDERGPSDSDFHSAFDELILELRSPELVDTIETIEVPPERVITESNQQIQLSVVESVAPLEIKINALLVKLYVEDTMSVNDPYVITDSTSSRDEIIVIVNKNHPFWNELSGSMGIKNYLRQCVYDGVAEWKAHFKVGNILPDTIKYIKDDLLRVPYIIERTKAI